MKKKIFLSLSLAFIGASMGFATLQENETTCVPVTTSCQFETIVCGDDIFEIIDGAIEADELLCP
ncbi:hypothetical protein Belba_0181 [Belliella baltica DSM 15883]|uniref:Uncharacterized protein n=1 Tax=Belliella baltica (strain DSM 15883 / CIP 108006 / LMG 21964 / BA134) TaxID=866536 RepID=I3Z0T2_BELBD|nr:hypothetical protein [Belliella baltica]AFL82850.1 hypothetical protein Belba_0181 [Belliella baltica DSM 15883]